MGEKNIYEYHETLSVSNGSPKKASTTVSNQNNYGCLSFIADCVMTVLTAGLWLIWVFVREMRKNR